MLSEEQFETFQTEWTDRVVGKLIDAMMTFEITAPLLQKIGYWTEAKNSVLNPDQIDRLKDSLVRAISGQYAQEVTQFAWKMDRMARSVI